MKVAVIGSRDLTVPDLGKYLPEDTTELVSGGARGVDTSAREYAEAHGLKITEFLPEYEVYGRRAPLRRNCEIIDYADLVLAFWDGESRGTAFVIKRCRELGKPVRVYSTGRNWFKQLSFSEMLMETEELLNDIDEEFFDQE